VPGHSLQVEQPELVNKMFLRVGAPIDQHILVVDEHCDVTLPGRDGVLLLQLAPGRVRSGELDLDQVASELDKANNANKLPNSVELKKRVPLGLCTPRKCTGSRGRGCKSGSHASTAAPPGSVHPHPVCRNPLCRLPPGSPHCGCRRTAAAGRHAPQSCDPTVLLAGSACEGALPIVTF